MTRYIERIENQAVEFIRKYGKFVLGGLLIGILAYFMMMASDLVNDLDGIWHLSNFIAGDWEISLGRGLQRYADRARFGIVSCSFNTILTLLIISIANTIIFESFFAGSSLYAGLVFTILTVNPVICNSLSYSYMSVNFGLAFLFSVIAFRCIKVTENWKKSLVKNSVCGLFLGISLAFYQAYICVTAVLVVIFVLKMLCEKKELKVVFQYITSSICTVLFGGVFYFIITKALLYRAGIQLASYKGTDNINLMSMLRQLPYSMRQCYVEFGSFFYTKKAFSNLEFIDIVLAGLFLVYLFAVMIQLVKLFQHSRVNAFLFIIMVMLLPVASCFVLLIAVGNSMTGLMSMGLVISTVLLGMIIPKDGKTGFWLKRVYIFLIAVFAWFQFSMVANDQLALKEGKDATITLTENIVSQLYSDGYLDDYQAIAFVGRPGNNSRFAQNAAYQMANDYAKFGCWSTSARNNRASWAGITSNFLGVHLNLCGVSEYQELVALEQVADMPEFPLEGSICVINDIVVVKVSALY